MTSDSVRVCHMLKDTSNFVPWKCRLHNLLEEVELCYLVEKDVILPMDLKELAKHNMKSTETNHFGISHIVPKWEQVEENVFEEQTVQYPHKKDCYNSQLSYRDHKVERSASFSLGLIELVYAFPWWTKPFTERFYANLIVFSFSTAFCKYFSVNIRHIFHNKKLDCF